MNIDKLGQKLVKCSEGCSGVTNNPDRGIIPRCLLLEKRKGKNKCVVVGLNPGKSKKKEQCYYLDNNLTYDSVKNYFFKENHKNWAYYKRTRDLVSSFGFDGDILWTELAKCECSGRNGVLPIQTLRVCINIFLKKEIELFKAGTIFALGNVAFSFCALSLPSRFVVGLPHPASYGNFLRLKRAVKKDPNKYRKELAKSKKIHGNYQAIRIP